MRTEIDRHFTQGFVLSEQELRRMAQSCQGNAAEIGARDTLKVTAKLKDGSLIDGPSIDDALNLENEGQKVITCLSMVYGDEEESGPRIEIVFENGLANLDS